MTQYGDQTDLCDVLVNTINSTEDFTGFNFIAPDIIVEEQVEEDKFYQWADH